MSISIYFTPLVFIVGTINLIAMLFFVISFIALGFNPHCKGIMLSAALGA